MNAVRKIPSLKGREFNGKLYPKLKRIRTTPRQNIRRLLRSFIPLNHQKLKSGAEEKTG